MRLMVSALAAMLAAGIVAPGAKAQTAGNELVIGVPMPLTGVLSQAGQLILSGIRFAADEANQQGGVLGRQLKLVVEDTKGEPNTAATIAAKMATQDKVYAFVGGYGSTADFALLQGVKRYQPIFVHPASSSTRLETTFGPEPWYFHVYIWDYHRQKAATSFFESLSPRPKKVAVAYEDGLYGSDAAKYSEKYMKEAGFDMVMKEPFKTGSPDFSPILNRVKSADPDVFFFVGYSGDNIQIARQAKSLGITPKLMLIVSAGEKRPDFGDFGEGIAVIGEYAREQRSPGNEEWVAKVEKTLGAGGMQPAIAQGYTAMYSLVESIKAAKSLERDSVLKALETGTFRTPYGDLSYKPSDGGAKHQLLSNENMVVVQYRASGQDVVWPQAKASGKVKYPVAQ
jgi:branched-chain amino acid transport system substrate-binding protein